MKKKCVIIPILAVVTVAVICGVIFGVRFFREKNANTDSLFENSTDFISLFKQTSVTALKEQAAANKIVLKENAEAGCFEFEKLPVDRMQVTALFFNNGDTITKTFSKIEFQTAYSKDLENAPFLLEEDIAAAAFRFEELFETDIDKAFNIYHAEGYLLNKEEKSTYQLILEGQASVLTVVKENEEFYWKIRGNIEAEKFVFYVEHISENIMDQYADIVLE